MYFNVEIVHISADKLAITLGKSNSIDGENGLLKSPQSRIKNFEERGKAAYVPWAKAKHCKISSLGHPWLL